MARLTSSESRNSAKPFRVTSGAGGATGGAGGATTTGLGFGRDDGRGRGVRAVRGAGLSLVVSRFLSSLGRNNHRPILKFRATENGYTCYTLYRTNSLGNVVLQSQR